MTESAEYDKTILGRLSANHHVCDLSSYVLGMTAFKTQYSDMVYPALTSILFVNGLFGSRSEYYAHA